MMLESIVEDAATLKDSATFDSSRAIRRGKLSFSRKLVVIKLIYYSCAIKMLSKVPCDL